MAAIFGISLPKCPSQSLLLIKASPWPGNYWSILQVMSAADANIEVCGGTFVQMQSDRDTSDEAPLDFEFGSV